MPQDGQILTFPAGLEGFPGLTTFQLLEPSNGYPLKFLQSTTQPEISFVCMDAAAIRVDYEVPLSDEDAGTLNLEQPEDALVLVTVVVPEDPRQMTANLAGPLVINTKTRQGRQIILDTRQYPLQYPIISPQEDLTVSFPAGLIGFPEVKSFRLFEPPGAYPLKFLQAVGQEELTFVCVDIAAIKTNFQIKLSEEDAAFLAIEKPSDALVLALVVVPEDPRQMTANLAGPLVIHTQTRQGRQIVLSTDEYPLKYPIVTDRQGS